MSKVRLLAWDGGFTFSSPSPIGGGATWVADGFGADVVEQGTSVGKDKLDGRASRLSVGGRQGVN